MDIIQPLDLESSYRTFSFNNQHHLVVTLKLYFPLQGGDPILFSDAYKKMADLPTPFIDEGLPKITPEYFVAGNAMAPGGHPVGSLDVTAKVGNQKKSLRVIGDRYWIGGLAGTTNPVPFSEMPLIWSRAFGGKKHPSNPDGRGIDKVATTLGENLVAMPNIEYANQLMTGLGQTPKPAGFMPFLIDNPQRSQYLGTYDEHWLANRFPGYPDDFNLKAFNAAPEDQLISTSAVVGDSYELSHFHADFTTIEGRVPDYRPRVFLVKQGLEYDQITPQDMREIKTQPDTLVLFPNQLMGMLIYRGTITTTHSDCSEYKHLICGYEESSQSERPKEHYHASLVGRLHPDLNMQFALTTKDLIPDSVPCGMARMTQQEVEPRQLLAENMQAKLEETLAEANARAQEQLQQSLGQLQQQGKDTSGLEAKLAEPKEGAWQKRFNEILEKIAPGSTNANGKVDLQKIDFRAFDDLSKLSEEYAEHQKQKVKDQLEEQVASTSNPEQKAALQKAILKLELPPVLPRPQEFEATMKPIRESVSAVEQQNRLAAEKGFPVQPVPDLVDLESKIRESIEATREGYRQSAHMTEEGTPPLAENKDQLYQLIDSRLSKGKDLSNLDLAGLDFSNRNMKGVDFSGSYLEQCDFSGTNLEEANLECAILARSTLSGANLKNANCRNTNIGACDFTQANLSHANLNGAEIAKSNFTEADLSYTDLSNTLNMLEVCFRKANLQGVTFDEPTFLEIDFSYANLIETKMVSATFNQCQLLHAKFDQSQIEGTNFIESDASFAQFVKTEMVNCRFVNKCKLHEAKFIGANASESCFRTSDMQRAQFINCLLDNSDFGDVHGHYVNFDGSQARFCQCMSADFTRANLSNANFFESSLMQANLTEAKLKKSNFYGTEFMGATVGKTDFGGSNLDDTKLADWRPSKWQ